MSHHWMSRIYLCLNWQCGLCRFGTVRTLLRPGAGLTYSLSFPKNASAPVPGCTRSGLLRWTPGSSFGIDACRQFCCTGFRKCPIPSH